MADELLLLPPVPDALREAAQLGRLIPFVGAGVSLLAGCPNWCGFADGALRCFVEQGKFSHAQFAQLAGLNPRVKLSLALQLQDELEVKIDFETLLHPAGWRDHRQGRRVYHALGNLGRTFVTTNYDRWLDQKIPAPSLSVREGAAETADPVMLSRRVFHQRHELTAENLNTPDAVLHLHGSVLKPEGMVVTTREYVTHYANDRRLKPTDPENSVLTFLTDLFRNKVVLFVGYGLEELEVLEYVILKTVGLASPGMEPRHFILQGFFSHERELMLGMKRYYRDCGIQLLPFSRDQKNWDQLVDVLEALARDVPASNLAVLQELDEMGDLLNG